MVTKFRTYVIRTDALRPLSIGMRVILLGKMFLTGNPAASQGLHISVEVCKLLESFALKEEMGGTSCLPMT